MRIIVIFCLLLTFNSFCQTNVYDLATEVLQLNRERHKHGWDELRDSVFTLFNTKFKELMHHPDLAEAQFTDDWLIHNERPADTEGVTLAYGFMNSIKRAVSEDKKLVSYSYDHLGGGSGHTYTAYVIYSNHGKTKVVQMDSLGMDGLTGSLESLLAYYEINQTVVEGNLYYFLFGYGTMGGGGHYKSIRVFTECDNEFHQCSNWFEPEMLPLLSSNRTQNVELQMDTLPGQIKYKRFVMDEDIGFYNDTFEWKSHTLVPKAFYNYNNDSVSMIVKFKIAKGDNVKVQSIQTRQANNCSPNEVKKLEESVIKLVKEAGFEYSRRTRNVVFILPIKYVLH
jgi:hypothetical protein